MKYKLPLAIFLLISVLVFSYFQFFRMEVRSDDPTLIDKSTKNFLKQDLEAITIVRVPDTPSHKKVQQYIVNQFVSPWKVEFDTFIDKTPIGNKNFSNIIATINEDAPKFLVLSAHYDSKLFDKFEFVGATDSAIPCVILVNLGRAIAKRSTNLPLGIGIKIIFFDGEEAFRFWTREDSIYGSRHLVKEYAKKKSENEKSILERIDLFVLLDLIGAKESVFYPFFDNTRKEFDILEKIETRLRKQKNQLKSKHKIFVNEKNGNLVQDDHVPWLDKGVRVLHLIPPLFPVQWHLATDDLLHADMDTIEDWIKIMRNFVWDYLEIKKQKKK